MRRGIDDASGGSVGGACGRLPEGIESRCGLPEPESHGAAPGRWRLDGDAWQAPVAVTIGPDEWSSLAPRPNPGAMDRRPVGEALARR
jgi:hypothetical protein